VSKLSEAEKKVFLDATNRRKARGVKLRKFSVMAERSQVEGLSELYDAWVTRFGKELALDHLILMWGRAEARLCDADQAKKASKP
jgi:hypothetical protein